MFELQVVRVDMGFKRCRWGDAAAGVWARLNLIQATPGVSWGTGAVVGTGGEVRVRLAAVSPGLSLEAVCP